jgi:hypothetical protein
VPLLIAEVQLETLLLEGLQSEAAALTAQDWAEIRKEVHRRHQERESAKG